MLEMLIPQVVEKAVFHLVGYVKFGVGGLT